MRKNVSGQKIGAQLVSAADGSAFTGAVTVAVTGDAGTQAAGSVGAGACTHEGGGYHTYAPAQAETDYDLIAFTFSGTGAVPATVQVYTRFDLFQAFPTNFSALAITGGGAVTAGTVSDKTGYSVTGTTTTLDALQTALNTAHGAGSWATATGFMPAYTQPAGFLAATFPTDPADQSLVIAATDAILTAVNLRATQTSVDDLPTNAELTTALAAADDAVLTAVAGVLSAVNTKASQASVDDVPTNAEFASAVALLATSAQLVKVLAAVYDDVERSGDVLTLSNGATQTITADGRETAGP